MSESVEKKVTPVVTQWFPPEVVPLRADLYERDYSDKHEAPGTAVVLCYWNGKFWGLYGDDEKQAMDRAHANSDVAAPWRYRASRPEAAA